jgi:hypothetical protein
MVTSSGSPGGCLRKSGISAATSVAVHPRATRAQAECLRYPGARGVEIFWLESASSNRSERQDFVVFCVWVSSRLGRLELACHESNRVKGFQGACHVSENAFSAAALSENRTSASSVEPQRRLFYLARKRAAFSPTAHLKDCRLMLIPWNQDV